MSNKMALALAGILLAAGTVLPASADEEYFPQVMGGLTKTPLRAAITGVGMVIGIPVQALRSTAHNTVATTKKVSGENANAFKIAGASLVAAPVGVFTGGLEGVWTGTTNSWANSGNKPFSPDMFSMGEMKD